MERVFPPLPNTVICPPSPVACRSFQRSPANSPLRTPDAYKRISSARFRSSGSRLNTRCKSASGRIRSASVSFHNSCDWPDLRSIAYRPRPVTIVATVTQNCCEQIADCRENLTFPDGILASPGAFGPPRTRKRRHPKRLRRASKADPLRRVFPKQVAVPDIAPDGGQAAMSGLVHDGAFAFARGGGGGREPGAETVAGEGAGIESERFDVALDDDRHRFAG